MKVIQQPSIGTLNPDLGESVDFENTNNIFIEGDNLEVLKLLQKSYFGKIKMIYIDPPYNTGKEFIYPDKFSENLDTYLEYSGQKDSQGRKFSTNTDTSGRYHTNWLNMMYPRLYLARNLLKEDGYIFISIDENEYSNLIQTLNQIFGEENHIADFVWKNKSGGGNDSKYVAVEHEYVVMFAKSEIELHNLFEPYKPEYLNRYKENDDVGKFFWDTFKRKSGKQYYPIECPDGSILELDEFGNRISWLRSKERFENDKIIGDVRIVKSSNTWSVHFKQRLPQGKKPRSIFLEESIWSEIGTTSDGSSDTFDLFKKNLFSNPKPVSLIEHVLGFSNRKDDLILDFFAGSSTTAHAIMRQNKQDGGTRKFIMVQLPEPCDETSEAYKAGFKTIADISRERIRRAGKKIKEEASSKLDLSGNGEIDVGFKAFKLTNSNFKVWDGNIDNDEAIVKQLELNVHNINDDSNDLDFVFEILLKSGFGLDTKIENIKNLGEHVYGIANNELIICLEKEITKQMIDAIADYDPIQVICLDAGFNGNDQLKTNAVQTFKSKSRSTETEIVFKTV